MMMAETGKLYSTGVADGRSDVVIPPQSVRSSDALLTSDRLFVVNVAKGKQLHLRKRLKEGGGRNSP